MEPEDIKSRLRTGQLVLDAHFDEWLADAARPPSPRFWTQVGVAVRVAGWLRACGVSTVLDVGSGAGKFCVVGALSSDISFTGIEHRAHLVDGARMLAERFGVTRKATFVHGEVGRVDFAGFDAVYFYNPFGENLFPGAARLDHTVETGGTRFDRDVAISERLLRAMPLGTYVVTYNGYGGKVPDSFDLLRAKVAGVNMLRLWRKMREHDDGGYWREFEDSTALYTARGLVTQV
jgi:SAM-dependent methyltransferase